MIPSCEYALFLAHEATTHSKVVPSSIFEPLRLHQDRTRKPFTIWRQNSGCVGTRCLDARSLRETALTGREIWAWFLKIPNIYVTLNVPRRPKLNDARARILVSRDEQVKTLQRIRRAEEHRRQRLERSIEAKNNLAEEIKSTREKISKEIVFERIR